MYEALQGVSYQIRRQLGQDPGIDRVVFPVVNFCQRQRLQTGLVTQSMGWPGFAAMLRQLTKPLVPGAP